MRRQRKAFNIVFLDVIMNSLLGFVCLFIVAYVQINPEAKQEHAIETSGKYAVVMRWPDGSRDDVDLYLRDPTGRIAYYSNRDVGLMHLEHDDLGAKSDMVRTKDGTFKADVNEERVIVRGTIPGEYTVNVHMYHKEDPATTPVEIFLYRLQGNDQEIVKKQRTLERVGDERTAFRFSIAADGELVPGSINELPRSFVGAAKQQQSGGVP
jgi:hypothetical protein